MHTHSHTRMNVHVQASVCSYKYILISGTPSSCHVNRQAGLGGCGPSGAVWLGMPDGIIFVEAGLNTHISKQVHMQNTYMKIAHANTHKKHSIKPPLHTFQILYPRERHKKSRAGAGWSLPLHERVERKCDCGSHCTLCLVSSLAMR